MKKKNQNKENYMKKDINKIIEDIQKEVKNLDAALYVIEISSSSVKRERYCKKFKLNFQGYMKLYEQARNEIIMYPVILNCMKGIINLRGKTQREYETLKENIMEILNDMIDKVKKEEQNTKITEMQEFLKDLNNKKPKKP